MIGLCLCGCIAADTSCALCAWRAQNPASPNEYQQAIAAVGSILVEYDHDQCVAEAPPLHVPS